MFGYCFGPVVAQEVIARTLHLSFWILGHYDSVEQIHEHAFSFITNVGINNMRMYFLLTGALYGYLLTPK